MKNLSRKDYNKLKKNYAILTKLGIKLECNRCGCTVYRTKHLNRVVCIRCSCNVYIQGFWHVTLINDNGLEEKIYLPIGKYYQRKKCAYCGSYFQNKGQLCNTCMDTKDAKGKIRICKICGVNNYRHDCPKGKFKLVCKKCGKKYRNKNKAKGHPDLCSDCKTAFYKSRNEKIQGTGCICLLCKKEKAVGEYLCESCWLLIHFIKKLNKVIEGRINFNCHLEDNIKYNLGSLANKFLKLEKKIMTTEDLYYIEKTIKVPGINKEIGITKSSSFRRILSRNNYKYNRELRNIKLGQKEYANLQNK